MLNLVKNLKIKSAKFLLFLLILGFCNVVFLGFCNTIYDTASKVVVRIDDVRKSEILIALDFNIVPGEQIARPAGEKKLTAPKVKFKNAKIYNAIWPSTLNNESYYTKKFTVLYLLKKENFKNPIEYDISYVICTDYACIPVHESGIITKQNEKSFTKQEVDFILGTKSNTIFVWLLLAFLGGIILNCMPCSLPILSLKIYSILNTTKNKLNIRMQSFLFALGIIFTFMIIAIWSLWAKSSLSSFEWGVYMQEPRCIVFLFLLFLFAALNFFGIGIWTFTIPLPKFHRISNVVQSFVGGIFMAIISTSCAGPFSGAAIFMAATYNNWQTLLILASLGLGVAAPFLLLAISPKMVKIFPKPGIWMEKFKIIIGFIMLFSCIWLLWVLAQQTNIDIIMKILCGSILLAMFLWLKDQTSVRKRWLRILFILSTLGTGIFIFQATQLTKQEEIWIKAYSEEAFQKTQIAKQPILLIFTAAWCLNCQYNKLILQDQEVKDILKKNSVTVFVCDLTKKNEIISSLLAKFSSNSVPFVVFFPTAQKEYIIMPRMLTKNAISKMFEK